MIPIELLWFIIVILFGLIGVVRGYLRELGVTTVMVVALFSIITADPRMVPLLCRVLKSVEPERIAFWVTAVWVVGLAVAAFVSYHGETLAFEGSQPKGALAVVFNLGVGLVNGYLIAGSVWFYLDRLGYPLLGIRSENLSALANQLLRLSAPCLLAPYLLYLVVFLVLMRVIK
ncbi:MAG: hypothetical protein ACUVX9_01085 [Anaerolineae bacterium]